MASPTFRAFMSTLVVLLCLAGLMALIFGGIKEARGDSLSCYEGGGELIKPEYINTNLLIKVNWFDTMEELLDDLISYDPDNPEWVEYVLSAGEYTDCDVYHENADIGFCEVWAVMPKYVLGDPYVDGFGHEALHGLFGDYHE